MKKFLSQVKEDISLSQMVAGPAGAVTVATILTSTGIAGTTVGIVVGSIVGSFASVIYKHGVSTSTEGIKKAVEKYKDEPDADTIDIDISGVIERTAKGEDSQEIEDEITRKIVEKIKKRIAESEGLPADLISPDKKPPKGTNIKFMVISFLVSMLTTALIVYAYTSFFDNSASPEEPNPTPITTPLPTPTQTIIIQQEPSQEPPIIIYPKPSPPIQIPEPITPLPTPDPVPTPPPFPTPPVKPSPDPVAPPTDTPNTPKPTPTPTPTPEPTPPAPDPPPEDTTITENGQPD